MNHFRLLLTMLVLSVLTVTVFAGNFSMITGAELKNLIDRKEAGLVIIDSRSRNQYEEGHIKGAVSLPLPEMEQDPVLPKVPKDAWIVFYCSGTT